MQQGIKTTRSLPPSPPNLPQLFLALYSSNAERKHRFNTADEGISAVQIAPAGMSLACVTWDEAVQLPLFPSTFWLFTWKSLDIKSAVEKKRSNTNTAETKKAIPTYLKWVASGKIKSIIQEYDHLAFSLQLFIVFCGNPDSEQHFILF